MADEYIRRDAAMKAVASQYGACRSPAQNRMIDEIRNKIRRMPAANVANESSPREACGLPKQGNACPYAKLAPYLCARCGWTPEEHARRQALPLTENADGLRHKDISQPED